jgi:hypothetical protein
MRFILLFFAISVSLGCGSESQKSRSTPSDEFESSKEISQVFGLDFLNLGSTSVSFESGILRGDGQIVFDRPLRKETHFEIQGYLQKGSEIEWIFLSNQKLEGGVRLKLTRPHDRIDMVLKGDQTRINLRSRTFNRELSDRLDGEFSFALDVHDEEPIHVILWEGQGVKSQDPEILESVEDEIRLGNARGRFWGLKLKGGEVRILKVKTAVRPHG